MTDPAATKSEGLVKKLLFPSFTDAGSNDAFQKENEAASESGSSEASTTVHNNLSGLDKGRFDDTPISSALDTVSDADFSEASTSLQNNLSGIPLAASGTPTRKPQLLAQQIGTPDSSGSASLQQQQQPPSFFASTKPSVVSKSPSFGPESPPKIPRRPLPAARNLSTVADAGSDGNIPTELLPASPSSLSTTAAPASEEPLLETNPDKVDDDIVVSSKEKGKQGENSVDHVAGIKPAAQILSIEAKLGHDKVEAAIEASAAPVWEEEATPAQTAFGKELMFNRPERPRAFDGASDVLSTASEMGTIVGTGQRMEDLEGMDTTDEVGSPIERIALSSDDYPDPVWDTEGISLPMLESNTNTLLARDVGRSRLEDEKKVSDREVTKQAVTATEQRRVDSPTEIKVNGMLSNAIRRIGSGLTGQRGFESAPNTPRAAPVSPNPRRDKNRLSPGTSRASDDKESSTPLSFLLRSPGSSAHAAANASGGAKKYTLSPRFSIWQKDTSPTQRNRQRTFAGIPEDETAKVQALSKPNLPFQIARSCLSFDAYDTSMDDQYEFTLPEPAAREFRESLENNTRWADKREHNADSVLRSSQSWDVAGTSSQASAFRSASYVRRNDRSQLTVNTAVGHGSPPKNGNRVRIMSDFSPATNKDMAMELRVPQRIEIEREDALDILSCLVERGVSLHQPEPTKKDTEDAAVNSGGVESQTTVEFGTLDVSSFAADLRELSKSKPSEEKEHSDRMAILDELLRAHEYTLEMSRASQSASSWLSSIGRSPTNKKEGREMPSSEDRKQAVKDDGDRKQAAGEAASETIDLLAARAMLHSAQIEATEKSEQADRLNEELAKCRAEIGRLRSTSQSAPFKSPNRSILDETQDDDDSDAEEGAIDRSFENASAIGVEGDSGFLDTPFLFRDEALGADDKPREPPQSPLRSALDEANEMIRKLHGKLKATNQADSSLPEEAPVVHVASVEPASPGNVEERTVNVRMLDAENFVTEWDELAPPLPPPPDHGLRSPIVAAVLQQWTKDHSLHESLLAWIDQVLAGGDPEHIPPLTISSLDHQVRDGFSMHVLPLLLRRPDIRVNVQTRAHRRTSYDMAVGVEHIAAREPFDVRRNLEATSGRSEIGNASVTHSTATALMSNGTIGIASAKSFPNGHEPPHQLASGLSYDEMAEGMSAVDQQSTGLMSALGGALGGLLTRRKPVPDGGSDVGSMAAMMDSPAAGLAQEFGFSGEDGDDHQPYHRVVSAPPGRIGVTFVEYRGHAMVSDVAPDSPLGGWIFPSDILIAIDELPVSGMRVRDIITVLKDRKDRQRALRVISSHAMNEFTLNSSAAVDTSTVAGG